MQRLEMFMQRVIKDNIKLIKRTIRIFIRSPRLASRYLHFRRLTQDKKWASAKKILTQIGGDAKNIGNARLVKEVAEAYLRFGDVVEYTKWQFESAILDGNIQTNHWGGEDLSDATLWISFRETEKQGLATGLNLTGYVKHVSEYAKYTILVVEKRLVELYKRTLPEVQVLAAPVNAEAKEGTRLVLANSLILRSVVGVDESTLNSLYIPILPDQEIAHDIREMHSNLNPRKLPVFGIEWGKPGPRKDEAPVEFWEDLVKSINAVFVILQYKYIGYDSIVNKLQSAAPGRIITDDSINQLVDLNGFAAQLSTLDAMISTHSSDSHLCGALGVPTFLICDDLFRRSCPVESFNKIPWYQNSVLYGKNSREWKDVFRDLKKDIRSKYD